MPSAEELHSAVTPFLSGTVPFRLFSGNSVERRRERKPAECCHFFRCAAPLDVRFFSGRYRRCALYLPSTVHM